MCNKADTSVAILNEIGLANDCGHKSVLDGGDFVSSFASFYTSLYTLRVEYCVDVILFH